MGAVRRYKSPFPSEASRSTQHSRLLFGVAAPALVSQPYLVLVKRPHAVSSTVFEQVGGLLRVRECLLSFVELQSAQWGYLDL